jgi:plastocyanin
MRGTLALWTALVVLGVVVYSDRYLTVTAKFAIHDKSGGAAAAPLFQLAQAGSDLNMHATEMQDAAARGNLPTTKRHAEHLVNLIEGKTGAHYGDLDGNGMLEDPGDGTGALIEVRRVGEATHDAKAAESAAALAAELTVIRDNALTVLSAPDLAALKDLLAETVSVARRANAEGISTLNGVAQAAGVLPLPYTEPLPMAMSTPQAATVTVIEEDYGFTPYQVTVSVGTTVVWVNKDSAKHTVTADDGSFDSGDQGTNEVYQYTFEKPGRYSYFCRFHGDKGEVGMAGVIVVE